MSIARKSSVGSVSSVLGRFDLEAARAAEDAQVGSEPQYGHDVVVDMAGYHSKRGVEADRNMEPDVEDDVDELNLDGITSEASLKSELLQPTF